MLCPDFLPSSIEFSNFNIYIILDVLCLFRCLRRGYTPKGNREVLELFMQEQT